MRWSLLTVLPLVLSPLTAQASAWKHPDGTTHWYEPVAVSGGITWDEAHRAAAAAGGYLATITSKEENQNVRDLLSDFKYFRQGGGRDEGPWLGGVQLPGSKEPASGWVWGENEPMLYTNWDAGHPDNTGGANRLHFSGPSLSNTWGDAPANEKQVSYVIEYSGPTVKRTQGLILREAESFDGYTLISPLRSKTTYLVDPRGRPVNRWQSTFNPGVASYMLPRGHLLRCGNAGNTRFTAGGTGGLVERFDWKGKLIWQFKYSTDKHCQHHDVEVLPNGNVLMFAWVLKTKAEAIAAGRDPNKLPDGELWPEQIIEVEPQGATGGKIVWEWNAWDHLIQDFDGTKANFGDVAKHPELIDVNYEDNDGADDWLHANSIAYNAKLDQIVFSVRVFSEIWVIDHSTTTAQAAGHTGGRGGKGGDLIYRWGNPAAYRGGTAADQQLHKQHNAHWIPDGLPGAGNLLIFNNGNDRPGGPYSTVDEIVTPIDSNSRYPMTGTKWGPVAAFWTYRAPSPKDFYSAFVSGAQRMWNGNTLIGIGSGLSFEVTRFGKIVWQYQTPVDRTGAAQKQGDVPNNNVIFRSPRYFANGPELRGKKLRPGAPIETHDSVLLVEGSAADHRAKMGTEVALELRAKDEPGRQYLIATSATPGLLPIDYRFARIGWDELASASVSNSFPTVFKGYMGKLDPSGRANASIALPNHPALAGLELFTTFVVADPLARSGFSFLSNTVTVEIY